MGKETENRTTFERNAAIFMAVVCAISLLAGAGWLFNQPILASFRPKYIPAAPADVLIFLGLCSTWLIQRVFHARRGMRILVQAGLLGMLIVVLILAIRYFTGLGPDLEKLLYPDPPLFGQFSSARMSPLSALGFFLAIPAFLLMTGGKPGTRTKSASAVLSLALFIFSGLICLGYLYKAPPFYGGSLIPEALTSAISFWFLSLGLLMTAGPSGWPARIFTGPSINARLMRAFIPASILIVVIQGFLSSDADPWIIHPALKVAIAVFISLLIVILIISLIANNLSEEIERGRKAEKELLQSGAELRALFASMHDVVVVIDRAGIYRMIAPTNPELLVKPSEELLGKTLRDVFPPEQAETFINVVQQVLDTKKTLQIEYDLTIGELTMQFETSISPMTADSTLWVARDITERKRAETELTEERHLLRTLLDSLPDHIYFKDRHSRFTHLSESQAKRLGLNDPADALGKTDFDFFTEEHARSAFEVEQKIIATGQPVMDLEEKETSPDGRVTWVNTTKMPFLDQAGAIIGTFGISRDITERNRMEEEIRNLSLTDELTGLYNRRGFTLLGEHEVKLARREKRSMLLFFGDVDNLKMINDTHGHAQGDLALQDVSAILKGTFREADILARIGGDEFVVLAVDASLESTGVLKSRIPAALKRRTQQGDRPYQLTLSLGIAHYDPEAPCTVSELIAQADDRMYQQKQASKGKQ
jgi:diguanylate cyclase (GGDEF)-like protein/PAS domain S-box-containing protein